jgi:hypothetical protein
MPTFHLEVLQRVLATQQAIAGLPAARVFAERESPLEKDECPGINLSLGQSRTGQTLGSDGDWDVLGVTVQFVIAVHTRGEPQTTLADPFLGASHAAVMADPSLGGVAMRLRFSGSQRRASPADATAGIYDMNYEVTVAVSERTLALHTI